MKEQEINIVAILEALLFMYGRPVSFSRIGELLEIDNEDVVLVVSDLQKEYDTRKNCGMSIIVQDQKVQIVSQSHAADIIEKMTKKELEGPLTPVAMEVLAIIAYRGPINKIDVEAIRGVNCSFTLRNLLRRGLIENVQTSNDKRLRQYRVTIDFLRVLGVTSVNQLPDYKKLSQDKRIDAIIYNDKDNEDIQ